MSFTELIKDWDDEKNKDNDPHNIHYGSNKPVWWKCQKCGNEYKAPIARRTKNNSGCRKCADKNMWINRRTKKQK